ncbi:hypothetical protein [Vibrio pectenicida]|uniref:Uncharacterized protein n=1 Tax=Vibrio pectenicida TaxID=62763 RepID=A0A3R9EC46_9VIBR|nr:hypothetical protein [Vibrio pectenicida]RSD28536.1 hypothetical protein EJA03_19195 [Vibrio pectenicida]
MKNVAIITLSALLLTSTTFANTSTYVYCGLPDGSDWDWLLNMHDNYEMIRGQWARVTEENSQYFNVFRVDEAVFDVKAFNCPAGYIAQPAESGTSRWEIFEIIRSDGSSYFIDGYKTYYSSISNQATHNDSFRL